MRKNIFIRQMCLVLSIILFFNVYSLNYSKSVNAATSSIDISSWGDEGEVTGTCTGYDPNTQCCILTIGFNINNVHCTPGWNCTIVSGGNGGNTVTIRIGLIPSWGLYFSSENAENIYAIITSIRVEDISASNPNPENGTVYDFVERMYQVTLDRNSDESGKNYWVNQLNSRQCTGVSCAYSFIFSNEFQEKGLSNAQYIECMYRAFFGRTSDSSGRNYWVGLLDSGKSRAEVFAGFANSDEFFDICGNYGIVSGTFVVGRDLYQVSQINLFVDRMYTTILGRQCDRVGMESWTNSLLNGTSGAQIAYSFVFSDEYIAKRKTDSEFISDLYSAILGRQADSSGVNYWKTSLDSGKLDKEIFNGFIGSEEFQSICSGYGINVGIAEGNRINARQNASPIIWVGNYSVLEPENVAVFTDTTELSCQMAGASKALILLNGNLLVESNSGSYTFQDGGANLPEGNYTFVFFDRSGNRLGAALCIVKENRMFNNSSQTVFERGDLTNWVYRDRQFYNHCTRDDWNNVSHMQNYSYVNSRTLTLVVDLDCYTNQILYYTFGHTYVNNNSYRTDYSSAAIPTHPTSTTTRYTFTYRIPGSGRLEDYYYLNVFSTYDSAHTGYTYDAMYSDYSMVYGASIKVWIV